MLLSEAKEILKKNGFICEDNRLSLKDKIENAQQFNKNQIKKSINDFLTYFNNKYVKTGIMLPKNAFNSDIEIAQQELINVINDFATLDVYHGRNSLKYCIKKHMSFKEIEEILLYIIKNKINLKPKK